MPIRDPVAGEPSKAPSRHDYDDEDGTENETFFEPNGNSKEDQRAKDFVASKKASMRLNSQDLSYEELIKHVTFTFNKRTDLFKVNDLKICGDCNLPKLFFHSLDRDTRCKETHNLDMDFIDDILIPYLLDTDKYSKKFLDSLGVRHQLEEGLSRERELKKLEAGSVNRTGSENIGTYERKVFDAPKWGENQDFLDYMEAINNWAMLHEHAKANQILFGLCTALENSNKYDLANDLRQAFKFDKIKNLNNVSMIEKLIEHLKEKFSKSTIKWFPDRSVSCKYLPIRLKRLSLYCS